MRIERVKNPLSLKDELLKFVFRVYQSTNGAYPALEWVENKPSPDDFDGFKKVYEPFLEFRLGKEFDELYVLRDNDGKIAGTVALVYNLEGKDVWWVPEEIKDEKTGLIEFFMVHPDYKGKGYGSKLLGFAIERLKNLGKDPYIITFPNLEAYEYYLRRGFVKVMDYRGFVVLKYRGGNRKVGLITYLILGLVIGFVAGLFGVGGGFLLVPSLVILGVPIHKAIGTSLACISISALASAYTHLRSGRVLYRVVLLKEMFSIPSAILGAYLSSHLPERLLRVVFGVLLLYLAVAMLRSKKGDCEMEKGKIEYRNVPLVGLVSGLVSGLLGVSGGILNVPLFHTLVGIPIKYAVGTSSLALLFTALAGTFEHWRLGHVQPNIVLFLAPGLIMGARLGAKTVSRVNPRSLRAGFAALLAIVAVRMLL